MYTIRTDYRDETVIEKSRFICTLKKVSSETEAQDFIKVVKKEFWDATHNCSAYIIDELAQRSSDDGEPSGTAGLPMLEVLRKNQLSGVAAVVTRYFGGIKLGAGGLVRAYTGSVSKAVQSCGLARKILMGTFALSADTKCLEGRNMVMFSLLSNAFLQKTYHFLQAAHLYKSCPQ